MREQLRVLQAFLARDIAMSMSYRLDMFLRLFSVLFLIGILYFASHLIGDNAALDAYGGYLPYAALGMAVMNFFQVAFRGFATTIRNEQMMGTLEAVVMTPARLPAVILGSVLWGLIQGFLTVLVYLAAVRWMFHVPIRGSWMTAGLLVLLTMIVFSCMGVISASFIMAFKRGDPLPFIVGALSVLLGGVFFPVSVLPGWMQSVSALLPVTHGLHGLREVLLRGASFEAVLPEIRILLLFVILTLPLCLLCFALALRRVRREGSLLVY